MLITSGMRDPRPHTGEPPALDLLNTRWAGAEPGDLLADLDGLRTWLELIGLAYPPTTTPSPRCTPRAQPCTTP